MKCGVVIVTYNRLKLVMECIENCLKQTYPLEKIVIVNNCSQDGTTEYLKEFEEDSRFVISNQKENLGGSGGFKAGLKIAANLDLDWILIIDDDAMICEDYIEQCMKFAKKHPGVRALSGTVMTDGTIHLIHKRRIVNKLLLLETNVPSEEYRKEAFKYDMASFCGLMIYRKTLRKIGLPKAEYFIWYDDSEFSLRLRKFGGIVNVNSAVLNHKTVLPSGDNGGFFGRMSWRTYYGHRNRMDAVLKHCGKMTQFLIVCEFYVFISCGYLMQLSPKWREKGKYIVEMLKDALHDGLNGKLGKNQKYIPGGKGDR